ncbi:phosphoribosylanthranilate isomerase [Polynucleobacter sp. 30F-ANTBAC]|jgi:phosphoribosylanthranilate isomerase|uniref:phosphoribosylanthranilate isomerase n=1 Tax=Polynucleobacter sp. 30F-ANTBAC TaxID=2689095 RepID=UPI001C0CD6EE|nr:phosphoribosylanthranilate isomerase [Polynucleobacter sp. 30F-ANTBAC]MBU3598958.1 phosphoribosylanthranilate isomerase [Polynucleobacter sp. 30F-ANTBAC]
MGLLKHTPGKTRIKFCGFTRSIDVDAAVRLGVDALGFVFYEPSPRYVSPEVAATLVGRMPGGMDAVALVVNPTDEQVLRIKDRMPVSLWQFHGDESPERCTEIADGSPWIKAARMQPGFRLEDFSLQYSQAAGFLLDAFVEGYGGGGHVFDWSLIPELWAKENAHRVVLSGGLNTHNVGEGISHLQPCAVDISSGIEIAKGQKSPELMQAFIQAVRDADASILPI